MFNCKFAIAQLAAAFLVSGVAMAHAQQKADLGMPAATPDVQPAEVTKRSVRSRYGSGNAVVPAQTVKRSNQRMRANTLESAGASTPALAGASVGTTKSVSATKRSRYPAREVVAESARVAEVKP